MNSEVPLISVFLLPPLKVDYVMLMVISKTVIDGGAVAGAFVFVSFFGVMVLSAIVCEVKQSSGIEFKSTLWLYWLLLN